MVIRLLSLLGILLFITPNLKAGLAERCLIALSSEFRNRTTLSLPVKIDQCDLLVCESAAELEFLSQVLGVPLYVPYYLAKQVVDQLVVAVLKNNPPVDDIVNDVLVKKQIFLVVRSV